MKLLASDIDGTFIDDSLDDKGEYNIPATNVRAVNKWLLEGNAFLFASGRTYFGEKQFAKDFIDSPNVYYSTCNGGTLYDGKQTLLMGHLLPYRCFLMMMNCFPLKEDNTYMVYFPDGSMGYLGKENFAPVESRSNKAPLKDLNGLDIPLDTPIEKASIAVGDHKAYDYKPSSELLKECDAFATSDFFFEIGAKGVDKSVAVSRLASILKIRKDDIYVCGDSVNDLGMLSRFHSAAPSNAIKEAKDRADYVGCHAKDGIIHDALTNFWGKRG